MADLMTAPPLVLDTGSGSIKGGYAGKDTPEVNIPCLVGRQKFIPTTLVGSDADEFIGDKARSHRGLLALRYPIRNGIVTNWEDMEKLWRLCYSEMKVTTDGMREHPIHATEAPLNPKQNRIKMAEMFFETFQVPAFYCSIQGVLSLYSSGRLTGVSLDCGDGTSHAVPMIDGFVVPYGVERSDIGGRDVTMFLRRLLRRSGHEFHTTGEIDLVRDIKESVCEVNAKVPRQSYDIRDMLQASAVHTTSTSYTLPDKTQIEVGAEKNWAPEALFHPLLTGQEHLGVHELIQVAISRSPIDSRNELWNSIVLSGGSTLFKNFSERLLAESKKVLSKETNIRLSAPPNRQYSVFIGGAILAAMTNFKKLAVTKKEYDENGPNVIARKLGDIFIG